MVPARNLPLDASYFILILFNYPALFSHAQCKTCRFDMGKRVSGLMLQPRLLRIHFSEQQGSLSPRMPTSTSTPPPSSRSQTSTLTYYWLLLSGKRPFSAC